MVAVNCDRECELLHTCPEGKKTMTAIRMMLATAGLFLVAGAIDAARADDDRDRVALYTAPLRGDTFNCNAVNVSDKTLQIAFAVLDDNGDALKCTGMACSSPPPANPAPAVFVRPGKAATIGPIFLSSPDDGYCAVDVIGTGDRDDVRAVLAIVLTRTIPGTSTLDLVVRSIEGH
jgi:hypothetical protein